MRRGAGTKSMSSSGVVIVVDCESSGSGVSELGVDVVGVGSGSDVL